MGLRLVYGKSGTGKSTFLFNEIKEKISANSISSEKEKKKRLEYYNIVDSNIYYQRIVCQYIFE